MQKFIAYYRVSSRQQEASHLSLEAQRSAVMDYIANNGNRIIAEFTEVESGKKNRRPQLSQAIALAKREDATLVIARLDRLSRNVFFISALMESKVKFIALDMKDATPFTIHIYAALAQQERDFISTRTKAALDAKKIREPNWKPGTPENLTDEGRVRAWETLRRNSREDIRNRHAYHFIKPRIENGETFVSVAKALNAEGYVTREGNAFTRHNVRVLYVKFKNEEE